MTFSIESFKARGLAQGGARPSLFQVQLSFPQIVGGTLGAFQGGRFLITATQLPEWHLGEVRIPYFGRAVKFKGDRVFQDWTVTVLNDEDFVLRDAFEAWSNYMNYQESNIMDPEFWAQGYKQDLLVQQFAKDGPPGTGGENGRVIREYQMIGAWPTVVSPITLDWSATDQIEMFQVTFAYDWFLPFGGEGAPSQMQTF